MKWRELLDEWGMSSLKINVGILQSEWKPNDHDKTAAWEMYVELLTRITTQPLPEEDGDEAAALSSVYSLFPITRQILKAHGRHGREFSRLAVVVLNQIIRPFTAKWHRLSSTEDAFKNEKICAEFRGELGDLQLKLTAYARLLASVAGVEDLTTLNKAED